MELQSSQQTTGGVVMLRRTANTFCHLLPLCWTAQQCISHRFAQKAWMWHKMTTNICIENVFFLKPQQRVYACGYLSARVFVYVYENKPNWLTEQSLVETKATWLISPPECNLTENSRMHEVMVWICMVDLPWTLLLGQSTMTSLHRHTHKMTFYSLFIPLFNPIVLVYLEKA